MKKIAIVLEEDIFARRGGFNAAHNRIKYLMKLADYQIDVYLIQTYENWIVRLLRHSVKYRKKEVVNIDGIRYNILWHDFSLVDYFISVKLHREAIFSKLYVKKFASKLRGYDILSCHSSGLCGMSTYKAHVKYSIPFFITWHGSDIHTIPFKSVSGFKITKLLIETAECNFYVSYALQNKSKEISTNQNSAVLYNGAGDEFQIFNNKERIRLKRELAGSHKVVAFVGNLIKIKNVMLLPDIFHNVQEKYGKSQIVFWIIGDGNLKDTLIEELNNAEVIFKYWGNQPPQKMPIFMNCIDVLVLPSVNEGMPLVTVEAISCGANAVGSRVGGIPESLGMENTFELNEKFVLNISDRIIEMLNTNIQQSIPEEMSWQSTAQKENTIYKQFLDSIVKQ